MKAKELIEKFELIKHPEGGHYKEVFRAEDKYDFTGIYDSREGERSFITSIYYLLESGDFSAFHKLKSDEIWFYHYGSPLYIHIIDEKGSYRVEELSLSAKPQIVITKNNWFAAELKEEKGFSFVSCVVAPGFEFDDFEMANRSELLKDYPQHEKIILKLTRG